TWRCGVVLHDVVVPVDDPYVSIGTDLGHDRRRPFIVAGEQVPRVFGAEAGAVGAEYERRNEVSGRFGDERGTIPILLRIIAGGIQSVAGAGGESAMKIDLANLVRDRLKLVAVRNSAEDARGPTAHRFIISIGNCQKFAGVTICRGAEDEPILADA